jgi:tRNA(fMet)-specific endonuclease VapC
LNFFLDTNIIIYFLKGLHPTIRDTLQRLNPNNVKIPSIVKAELLYGAEKSNQKVQNTLKIKQFLEPFEVISFDDKCTTTYSLIRASLESKGSIIGPNDIIIASTVLANNGTLVTHNVKEFMRIKNLKIENWGVK